MDYFRPHTRPRPRFEGYYSKFSLASGGQIILIISSVPDAKCEPHIVTLIYVPVDFPKTPHFHREIRAADIHMLDGDGNGDEECGQSRRHHDSKPGQSAGEEEEEEEEPPRRPAFTLRIPEVGHMTVYHDNTTEYSIRDPDGFYEFTAHVPGEPGNRVPWLRTVSDDKIDADTDSRECEGTTTTSETNAITDSRATNKDQLEPNSASTSTPEGILVNLPLPLHWHVHTLSSRCTYRFSIDPDTSGYTHQDPRDSYPVHLEPDSDLDSNTFGTAFVHQEKNWAYSFPESHVWIQARSEQSYHHHHHHPDTDAATDNNNNNNKYKQKNPQQPPASGINLAGGSILGTQSYLLTYHAQNPAHDVNFTPPFATTFSLPFRNPFSSSSSRPQIHFSPLNTLTTTTVSWETRTVKIVCSGPCISFHHSSSPPQPPAVAASRTQSSTSSYISHLTNLIRNLWLTSKSISIKFRRITITASAPRGTFIGLSAPFHDGHRGNILGQSLRGVVEVCVEEVGFGRGGGGDTGIGGEGGGGGGSTGWWGEKWTYWRVLCRERFEGAGLEFGGLVYGARGEEEEGRMVN